MSTPAIWRPYSSTGGVMTTSSVMTLPEASQTAFSSSFQTAPAGFVIEQPSRVKFLKLPMEPSVPFAVTEAFLIVRDSPPEPPSPAIPQTPSA